MRSIIINGKRRYFGYIPDPEGMKRYCSYLQGKGCIVQGQQIAQTVFGDDSYVDEDELIVLYPYLLKAFPNWQPIDQGIGTCMAFSCTHNTDTMMGVRVFLKDVPEKIVAQTCIETQYGFMRVEVFGQPDPGGDGAYGWAAAKSILEWGSLHNLVYDGYDLRRYSPSRARKYGYTGVPNDLESTAKQHPVKEIAKISDFDTAVQFIRNGYPISNADGSNPTFVGTRDKDGYARSNGYGYYAHAMNYIGVRWRPRPALLKVNTGWPETVNGSRFPRDMPDSISEVAWWEDADTCNWLLGRGDNWAYSQYQGFKSQKLQNYGTESYL